MSWDSEFDELMSEAMHGAVLSDMPDDDIEEVHYLRDVLGLTPREAADTLFGIEDKPRNNDEALD